MKKIVCAGLVFLAACDATQQPSQSESAVTSTQPLVEDQPQGPMKAELSFQMVGDPYRPTLMGITNLPDGTTLMVSMGNPKIGFSAGDKVQVSSGRFQAGPFSNGGNPLLPGSYWVSAGTPLSVFQPESVQALVGAEYGNLTGPLVKRSDMGVSIDSESKHVVPGNLSPQALKEVQAHRLVEAEKWANEGCRSSFAGRRMSEANVSKCVQGVLEGVRETMREGN